MKKNRIAVGAMAGIVFSTAIIGSAWYGLRHLEQGADTVSNDSIIVSDSNAREEPTQPVDDTLPTEETVSRKYIRITADTNLLKKSSYHSGKIARLKAGTEVAFLDENKDCYHVSCADETVGWVLKDKAEVFEKDVVITHVPKNPLEKPYSMTETAEGDNLGAIFDKYGTVGASVAVIKGGQVAYHYEYGYANKEKPNHMIPVTENTKFRIASVSKVFTSMLAMAEVDDGKLDLDGKLSDLFGFSFHNPKYPKDPVTMRMLLTHSAGLSGENLYSKYISVAATSKDYYFYKPGNGYYYSNVGMGFAGAAVEKASNQTISQYARDRFFAPMEIDASYDATYLSDKSLVADCYQNGRHKRSNEILTKPKERKNGKPGEVYTLGQGGLLISAIDLAKVSTILLNDGQYNGKQYLSHEAVEQMLTVQPVNTKSKYEQCIGLRKYPHLYGERDMYGHTGNYYGIYALMAIDPSDKSGVIVITSGAHTKREDNTVFEVCNSVLNYCYSDII